MFNALFALGHFVAQAHGENWNYAGSFWDRQGGKAASAPAPMPFSVPQIA
jgi:hypothetical protein